MIFISFLNYKKNTIDIILCSPRNQKSIWCIFSTIKLLKKVKYSDDLFYYMLSCIVLAIICTL